MSPVVVSFTYIMKESESNWPFWFTIESSENLILLGEYDPLDPLLIVIVLDEAVQVGEDDGIPRASSPHLNVVAVLTDNCEGTITSIYASLGYWLIGTKLNVYTAGWLGTLFALVSEALVIIDGVIVIESGVAV